MKEVVIEITSKRLLLTLRVPLSAFWQLPPKCLKLIAGDRTYTAYLVSISRNYAFYKTYVDSEETVKNVTRVEECQPAKTVGRGDPPGFTVSLRL